MFSFFFFFFFFQAEDGIRDLYVTGVQTCALPIFLKALVSIGIAGQASIDKVAGPVGEALIMTAIGLAVAVPAVLGYNWLVRRNKVTMESVRRFGADLHGVLMGARPVAAAVAAAKR